MNVTNLLIEVTRKCNMCCDHCLRGDAENINIKHEYIDSLLNQIDSIFSLTLTGGEPSMNVEGLEYILQSLKDNNIPLTQFYIATNGKTINEDFILFSLKLYAYCDEKEGCSIDVSNDMFHAVEDLYDMSLLQGLSFVNKKFEHDGYDYNKFNRIIAEGRGANYGSNHFVTIDNPTTQDELLEGYIYLNAKGNITLCCDMSYEHQDEEFLCHVDDLKETFEALPEDD